MGVDNAAALSESFFERYMGLIHIWGNWQVFLSKILGTCNTLWWSQAKHLPTVLFTSIIVFSDLFTILFLIFRENCMTSGSQIHEILPHSGENQKNSETKEGVE